MNVDKLKQLEMQVRIGGKGTARRKKKVVHKSSSTDDKKLQLSLKKLGLTNIPGIEEVNMIKDDGEVIHFNNPKVQASLASNTFAISGNAETKSLAEMWPSILNQLRSETLSSAFKKLIPDEGLAGAAVKASGEDDIPDLVENFEAPSMSEVSQETKTD